MLAGIGCIARLDMTGLMGVGLVVPLSPYALSKGEAVVGVGRAGYALERGDCVCAGWGSGVGGTSNKNSLSIGEDVVVVRITKSPSIPRIHAHK